MKSPTKVTTTESCVLYARVSTLDQADGYSIDAQLALLRKHADDHGLTVREEYVETNSAARVGRPAFARMVRDLRAEPCLVLVEKTDRLYRNFRDYIVFEDLGVPVCMVKEGATVGPGAASHDRLIHEIKLVIASNFAANLKEESAKGMLQMARSGRWPSCAPVGYSNVRVDGKSEIVPNEHAPTVAQMFSIYARGDVSIDKVHEYAKLHGLTSRGGAPYARSAVVAMLKNPIYKGAIPWKGELYDGRHQPIVTVDVWERCQAVMQSRTASKRGMTKGDYIFRRTFRCAVCGRVVSPYTVKGRYRYYACRTKGCDHAAVTEQAIDAMVRECLKDLRIRPETLAILRRALREGDSARRAATDGRVAILTRKRVKARKRLDQMYLDKLDGTILPAAYDQFSKQMLDEIRDIDVELQSIESAVDKTWAQQFALIERADRTYDNWLLASNDQKREMAECMFDNSTIDRGEVVLKLRPWFKLVFQANKTTANVATEAVVLAKWQG